MCRHREAEQLSRIEREGWVNREGNKRWMKALISRKTAVQVMVTLWSIDFFPFSFFAATWITTINSILNLTSVTAAATLPLMPKQLLLDIGLRGENTFSQHWTLFSWVVCFQGTQYDDLLLHLRLYRCANRNILFKRKHWISLFSSNRKKQPFWLGTKHSVCPCDYLYGLNGKWENVQVLIESIRADEFCTRRRCFVNVLLNGLTKRCSVNLF